MKRALILSLFLCLSACHKKTNVVSLESRAQQFQAPSESTTTRLHEARISIDTENQEIHVIRGIVGGPARLINPDGSEEESPCGVSLEDGSTIRYQILANRGLELNIAGELYEFHRINPSHGSDADEVYGDWILQQSGPGFSRNWTFLIREDEVLNIEISCANRFE